MPTCPNCKGLGFFEESDDECNLCGGAGVLKGEDEAPEAEEDDFPTYNNETYGEDADWWKKNADDEVKD